MVLFDLSFVVSSYSVLDSDIIEGPSRISLNCPIRYAMVLLLVINAVIISYSAYLNKSLWLL